MASAPSSTALAASLTSARVGRGSTRIDSSTCVARITGTARAPARSGRSASARAAPARAASRARDPRGRPSRPARRSESPARFSTAAGRSILAMSGTLPPASAITSLALQHVVGRLHEAQRDEIDAEREPEAQIGRVLRGHRRMPGSATPGALMPLCSPSQPPVTTTVVSSSGAVSMTRSSRRPSSMKQAIARPGRAHQLGVGREDPPALGRQIARADAQLLSLAQAQRAAARDRSRPDLRAAQILHDRDVPPGTA